MRTSLRNTIIAALFISASLISGNAADLSSKSNYVGRSTVFLALPSVASSPFGSMGATSITVNGCSATNTFASGSAWLLATSGGSPQPAPLIEPHWAYDTNPGSAWVGCPGQGENSWGTYITTFVMPDGFENGSLSILIHADNAAALYLNDAGFGSQPQEEIESNFQNPPSQFSSANLRAGANTLRIDDYNFHDPSGLDFLATVTYQLTNKVPVAQWTINDQTGFPESKVPSEGHMSLTADGMSQAIGTVINTTEIPTFDFTGDSLGCTLTSSGGVVTLTAGTNSGTVQVTATLQNPDSCLQTDFWFDLGSCQSCENCDVETSDNSVDIRVNLGPSRISTGQAFLQVKSEAPDPALGTPQLLQSAFIRPEVHNITNANGWLRQVAALDRTIDILTNSASSYSLHLYDASQVLPMTNGLYQFSGSPFRSVTIELVNGDTNHVRVTDSLDAYTSDFQWQTNGWALTKGGGLRTETKTTSRAGAVTTVLRTIKNSQQIVQSSASEKWQSFSFGDRLIQEVFGTGSNAQTNTYTYNTNGLLDTVTRYDGAWDMYQYDSLGRQIEHYSAFTNASPTTNSAACRRTSSVYTNSVVPGSGDDGTLEPHTPRRVVEYLTGVEVSRRYTILQPNMRIEIQCVDPGADWNVANNLFTITYTRPDHAYFGLPAQVIRTDGTTQLFAYEYQPLPGTASPALKKTTSWTGPLSSSGTVNDGVRQETWFSDKGLPVLEMQTDIASSILTSSNFFSYNERGNLTNTIYLDGTQVTQSYDCCHLLSTTERDGTVATYTYDALKRLLTNTRAGISSSNVYDAVGHVLKVVRYGTGSFMTLSEAAYNDGGQQTSATDALGNITRYTNYLDGSSQFIRQTTYPDLSTRVETHARDGSLLRVNGAAVHGLRYDYGIQSDANVQRRYTKEIKLDASGTDTTEWTKTLTDGARRAYKVIYADATTGTESDNPFSQSFFNAQGQLSKQVDPDGVSTLSQYNLKGQLEYTALDLNGNGVIDFDGTDRITRALSDVITNAALGANVTRTRVYAWGSDYSAVSNLLSATETSVNGLRSWQTTYRDDSTAVTSRTDTVYAGSGNQYVTNTAPDGSYSVTRYQYGRPISITRKDSLGTQLSSVTYSYDSQGRQSQATDGRNGSTTYTFNNADLVTSVTTPAPGNGQNAHTTRTYYNNRLQVTNTVAGDGASTFFEYYPSGELKRTYGARTYPVGYGYDYAGRVKTMTNWTSLSSSAGTRVTTWNYDVYRGWLTNKTYDAGAAGPDYTYTPAGRLKTRTWARTGTGGNRIQTTYTYGFNDGSGGNDHGDLISVTYANDPQSTASTTNTYDRRGRAATVQRNGITTTLAYNTAGQMLYQTNSGGTLNGLWVTNDYDSLMRRTALQAKADSTLYASHTFGYDNASRLKTVSDGTNTAAYTYLANSLLVSQSFFTNNGSLRMTTTRQFDYLNRLSSITSTNGQSTLSAFSYFHSDANQRIKVTLPDGSFWLYEYDSLGQVQSGKRYWPDWTPVAGQQFEYAHDDIGNRKSTKAGGDENGWNLRSATYSANNLNQYTNRTVPGAADVIGVALATNAVTVNGVTAYRHGEYFRREVATNNASVPVWVGLTISSGGSNVTGNVFVPKTPEVFTYDADGNLLSDGRWNYVWDAENRLLEMGVNTSVGAQKYLRFEYDWQGRRIGKKVWNNADGSGSPAVALKFLYDGWNCVVEANGSDVVQRRYLWGMDLSGSEQGAGGVGGLLVVNDVANGAHFVAYDGNGNVAGLVKASDGAITANYEYGPFGEALRATGPMAKANPFRFSTKYQDDETDLLYYGYRYYNPGTGRWVSRDPIGEDGGPNLYEFAENNGVNAVDPFGWNTFRIGFRGLGSKSVYGNQVIDAIGAEVGAQMYSQNESDSAVTRLLKEMDGNGDRMISCAESQQHTIKVFGYSYGGIAAIGFAQKLDQLSIKTGGSPKDPQGYKLCCPIRVQVLLTIDPVQLMNPAGGVSDNVDQFYNYYQRRGGYAVFRDSNGSADAKYGHFGSWFSSLLKGSAISPVYAKSSSQTRVDTDMATTSISGKFFQDAGQLVLYGSDVNHDVMPLFMAEKTISLMR